MRKKSYRYDETPLDDGYVPNDPPQNSRDEIELRIRNGETLKDQINQWQTDRQVERFMNLVKNQNQSDPTVDNSAIDRLDLY